MSYFQWKVGSTNYNPDSVRFENGVYASAVNVHKDTQGSKNATLWHKGVFFNGDTTLQSNFWASCPGAWRSEYTKNNSASADATYSTITSNGGLPIWYNSQLGKFCSNQSSDRVTLSQDFVRDGGYSLAPKNHARLFYNFQQPTAWNNISNCWIQQRGWDGTYNYAEMFWNANYQYGTSLDFGKVVSANFFNAFSNAKLYNGIHLDPNSTFSNAAYMFYKHNALRIGSGVPSFYWLHYVINNSPNCSYERMFEYFTFPEASEYQGRWLMYLSMGDYHNFWNCTTAYMFANANADPGELFDLHLYFNGGSHQYMFNNAKMNRLQMKGSLLCGDWSQAFTRCSFADHIEFTVHNGTHTGCFADAQIYQVNYGYLNNTGAYYMFRNVPLHSYHSGTQIEFNLSDCEQMFNNCRNLRYFGSWFSVARDDFMDGHDCEGFDVSTQWTCHMFDNTRFTIQYANQGYYYYQDMVYSAKDYADTDIYEKTMPAYDSWVGLAAYGRGYLYLYNPGFTGSLASYSEYDKVKYWLSSFVGVSPVSVGSYNNRFDIQGGSIYLRGTSASPNILVGSQQLRVSFMSGSEYAPKYDRPLRFAMVLEAED